MIYDYVVVIGDLIVLDIGLNGVMVELVLYYDVCWWLVSVINGVGEMMKYIYDENDKCISVVDLFGYCMMYLYDVLGILILVDESVCGGGIIIYGYDVDCNLVLIIDVVGC